MVRMKEENGYLKHGFSMRSALFDIFSRILRRKEDLVRATQHRIIKEFLGRYVSPIGFVTYADLLSR